MKKLITALLLLSTTLTISCRRESSLAKIATAQLPVSLEREMAEILDAVGEPRIEDLTIVYDCDSLCILQCKAYAKDRSGRDLYDTIRYIFVQDRYMSWATGRPVYHESLTGGKFLSDKEIKEFRKETEENAAARYNYYLGISQLVEIRQR